MTNKEQGLLDDLLKIEEGLTDWELGFIGDMDKQRAVNLSPKQQATFNRIAKRFDLGQPGGDEKDQNRQGSCRSK